MKENKCRTAEEKIIICKNRGNADSTFIFIPERYSLDTCDSVITALSVLKADIEQWVKESGYGTSRSSAQLMTAQMYVAFEPRVLSIWSSIAQQIESHKADFVVKSRWDCTKPYKNIIGINVHALTYGAAVDMYIDLLRYMTARSMNAADVTETLDHLEQCSFVVERVEVSRNA